MAILEWVPCVKPTASQWEGPEDRTVTEGTAVRGSTSESSDVTLSLCKTWDRDTAAQLEEFNAVGLLGLR